MNWPDPLHLPHSLHGTRITLKTLLPDNVTPAYHRWMNDPEVNKYLESRFRDWDLASLKSYAAAVLNDPDQVLLSIHTDPAERHIGNVKLGPLNRHHGFADVGIVIGEKDCWGKGLATEALTMLSDMAFRTWGLNKLVAGAYRENTGSIRAFLNAGFAEEGILHKQYWTGLGFTDAVLLGKHNRS